MTPTTPSGQISTHAFRPSVVILLLTMVILIKAALQVSTIDLLVAVRSVSSPLAYFWQVENPALAELNWPAGSLDFQFSTLMQSLHTLWQEGWFTEVGFLRGYGMVSISFQAAGVAFLVWALFRDVTIVFVTTCIFMISPLAGLNLGNFSAGIGRQLPVLFYSMADGFSFFAIGLVLMRRYILAGLCLAAAIHSHVILGLYAGVFAFGLVLATPVAFRQVRTWIALILTGLLITPVVLRILGSDAVQVSQLSQEDWILMSRLVNFHWHPIQLGLFDLVAHLVAVPMALLVLAWWMMAPLLPKQFASTQKQLIAGCVVVGLLSVIGIVFSDIWHIPTIMKAAPMRASMHISLAALFMLSAGIVIAVRKGYVRTGAVALFILLGFFVVTPGIGLLPLLALGVLASADGHNRRVVSWAFWIVLIIVILMQLGWSNIAWIQKWPQPIRLLFPVSTIDFSILGWAERFENATLIIAFISAVLAIILARRVQYAPLALLICAGVSCLAVALTERNNWIERAGPNAHAFVDAQLWARENTAPLALFMGDPTRDNGWREFSQRAWFGSTREWTHFATLYDSSVDRFEDGIARLSFFGPDPRTLDRTEMESYRGGKYMSNVLNPIYQEGYLGLNDMDFTRIHQQFGVTHLVARLDKLPEGTASLPRLYENDYYAIFALEPAAIPQVTDQ